MATEPVLDLPWLLSPPWMPSWPRSTRVREGERERERERERDFRWMRGLPRWRGRLRPIAVSSKICERDYSVDRTEKVNLYQQIEEYKQQL
jgi:hypothetical protein